MELKLNSFGSTTLGSLLNSFGSTTLGSLLNSFGSTTLGSLFLHRRRDFLSVSTY